MFFARGQTGYRAIEVQIEGHGVEHHPQPFPMPPPVDDGPQPFRPQDQVLGDRHARDKREMLVHHAEAQLAGLPRVGDTMLGAVYGQTARFRVVIPHHAFHQSALARAVLAQERMEGSPLEADRNVVQGGQGTEALGHPADGDFGRRARHWLKRAHREIETSPGAPAKRCLVEEL